MESYLESNYLSLQTLAKQSTNKESQNRIPIRLIATLALLARNDTWNLVMLSVSETSHDSYIMRFFTLRVQNDKNKHLFLSLRGEAEAINSL